jgi:hypothetical protein
VKVARSLAAAQVDEASQTHAAELGALQRRVAELEDGSWCMVQSFADRGDLTGLLPNPLFTRELFLKAAEED